MVISFTATAYLSLALVLIYYLLDCSPEADDNAIDRGVIRALRKTLKLNRPKVWGMAIQRAILMFSDQQLVTGIALLGAGCSQLSSDLPVYYWQVLVQLVWFSSISHLATLTCLRQYFKKKTAARGWRISLMIVLALMQIVALMPTGLREWPSGNIQDVYLYSIPAVCYFTESKLRGDYGWLPSSLSLVLTLVYLITSYVARLIRLSESSSDFFKAWSQVKPANITKRLLERLHHRMHGSSFRLEKSVWRILHHILLIGFMVGRACLDIMTSMLWEYVTPSILSIPQPLPCLKRVKD